MLITDIWARNKPSPQEIYDRPESLARSMLHTLILSLIAPACFYFSSTRLGIEIAEVHYQLQPYDALLMSLFLYAGQLLVIIGLAFLTSRFARSLGVESARFGQGFELANYIATPVFFCGLSLLFANIWFTMLAYCAGFAVAMNLLFRSSGRFFHFCEDKAFISACFVSIASAILLAMFAIGIFVISTFLSW